MDLLVMIALVLVTVNQVKSDSDTQVKHSSGHAGQGNYFVLMQHLFKLEGTVETKLKHIEEDIEELKSKVKNGPQGGNNMRKDMEEMKSEIENLSQDLESTKSEFRDSNSALKQETAALQKRISDVEKALSGKQPPGTTRTCPRGWAPNGNSCYKISTEKRNWASALAKCRSEGGYLAEIDDNDEGQFLKQKAMLRQASLWLGGSDAVREGVWEWVTSKNKISYGPFTDWNPGQPSNARGVEHCLHINRSFKYRWNDDPCETKHGYACEKQIG